jgi:hypothetical protein
MESILPNMSEESQRAYIDAAGDDHQWSHEEVMLAGLGVRAFMEADEAFTLDEGDVRFDPQGNVIAYNPKPPAQTSYAPTELQKTIEPLVGRGVLTREQADQMYLESLQGSGSETTRDKKIQDYQDVLGTDQETAVKLADGLVEMEINDKTGRVIFKDKVTGEAREVPLGDTNVFVPAPKPGRTLWDMKEWATGPLSALKAAWNIPAAIMNLPVDQRVTNARQGFATANQELIRSLAINPRYPVGEQERIREEISIGSQFFDDPVLMRERMVSLRDSLTVRMQQAERDASDPNMNDDSRKNAQSGAQDIRNYLAVLGVPIEGSQELPFIVKSDDEYDLVPAGAFYQAPDGRVLEKAR